MLQINKDYSHKKSFFGGGPINSHFLYTRFFFIIRLVGRSAGYSEIFYLILCSLVTEPSYCNVLTRRHFSFLLYLYCFRHIFLELFAICWGSKFEQSFLFNEFELVAQRRRDSLTKLMLFELVLKTMTFTKHFNWH